MGTKCHYAHGQEEMRYKDEVTYHTLMIYLTLFQPLPREAQMKMLNIPYNNYKTQRCKFFDQTGTCRFDKNCSYAHGDAELRNPYDNPTIPSFFPPVGVAGAMGSDMQNVMGGFDIPGLLPTLTITSATVDI